MREVLSMSYLNILQDIGFGNTLTQDDLIELHLETTTFEELGFDHVKNAESDKVQSIFSILDNQFVKNPPITKLDIANDGSKRVLQDITKKEMPVQSRFKNVQEIPRVGTGCTSTTTTTTSTTTKTTTTSTTSTMTTTTSTACLSPCPCSLLTTYNGTYDYVAGVINSEGDQYNGCIAELFADVCGDCLRSSCSLIKYDIYGNGRLYYELDTDPMSFDIQCPATGEIVITGSGFAADSLGNVAGARFTLTAQDNSPDKFQMVINAGSDVLNHNSGIIELTGPKQGDIIVSDCTSAGFAKLHAEVDYTKLAEKKDKLIERINNLNE